MAEDWQVNDLALCIKQGMWCDGATGAFDSKGPRAGQIFSVIGVGYTDIFKSGRRETLSFSPWPNLTFVADRFVKLRPEDLLEEDEEESPLVFAESAELHTVSYEGIPSPEDPFGTFLGRIGGNPWTNRTKEGQ